MQSARFGPDGQFKILRNGELYKATKAGWERMSDSPAGLYIRNETFSNRYGLEAARHRVVATHFVYNPRPGEFIYVDHINGNKLDNRAENLRWVNKSLNQLNRKSKTCKADPRLRERPHMARQRFLNKLYSLRHFATEQEAIDYMNEVRRECFDKLYWWYTHPNTIADPETWKLTKYGLKFPEVSD